MAPKKEAATDFGAFVSSAREKKKNQELADRIFTKNRRSSAPGAGAGAGAASRLPAGVPSLASRITLNGGISKRRSVSTSVKHIPKFPPAQPTRPVGNVDSEWTHDLHSDSSDSRSPARGRKPLRSTRGDRIYSALNHSASSPAISNQFNVVSPAQPSISIRGRAGPYTVYAKNFAPGTTAADIEDATVTAIKEPPMSCRLLSDRPTVLAELIYETKEMADMMVNTFNNQNADGHMLEVWLKSSGGAPAHIPSAPRAALTPKIPSGPRADAGRTDRYARDRSRERERRNRDYEARAEVVDGSYGFDTMDVDDDGNGARLYSDQITSSRGRNARNLGRGDGRGSRSRY